MKAYPLEQYPAVIISRPNTVYLQKLGGESFVIPMFAVQELVTTLATAYYQETGERVYTPEDAS